MSKVLVEMHAGTIGARSKGLGAGAEFIMRLPTAVRTAVAREPPAVERVRPRRKVLIIDDISDAALSLRDALRLAGHEVKTADRFFACLLQHLGRRHKPARGAKRQHE